MEAEKSRKPSPSVTCTAARHTPGSEPDMEAALDAAPPMMHPIRTRSRRLTSSDAEFTRGIGEVLERIPTALQPALSPLKRIHHFTFAWYTVTMSTSGVSLLLIATPHQFPGLPVIGLVVFLLALVTFLAFTLILLFRFLRYDGTFLHAATSPREALFVATFFISISALLSSMSAYGFHFLAARHDHLLTLQRFLSVMFWVYLGVTFVYSILQYHLLFSSKHRHALRVDAMTPAWILPVFPVMLAGTLAASFVPHEHDPVSAAAMALAGVAAQGLGMLISIFMFATYLSRLMAFGLPAQRPGMFMAVGPPSFTCSALIALADDAKHILDGLYSSKVLPGDVETATLAEAVKLLALLSCMFLWGLSFWFFCMAAAGCLLGMPDRKFHLSWFSFVFPNVGFALACAHMAEAVGSDSLAWAATAFAVALVMVWLWTGFTCAKAVYKREIVWPGHDEDVDE